MKKYSVILFDADGTLFDFPKCEREAFRDALLRSGVDADEAMVSAYHKINDDLWKALERKEIERSELVFRRFEIFAERYGLSIDSKIMARDYADCLAEKVYFIDGAKIYPADKRDECTVDSCHPNDMGYSYMADAFGEIIKPLIEIPVKKKR